MASAIRIIIKPKLAIGPEFATNRAIDAAATRVSRWLSATNHNLTMDIVQTSGPTNKDDVERLGRYDAIFRMIDAHALPAVVSTPEGTMYLNGAETADRVVTLTADGDHPLSMASLNRPKPRHLVDNIFHRDVPYAFSKAFRDRCGRTYTLAAIGELSNPEFRSLPSFLTITKSMNLPFVVKTVTRQKASCVLFIETEDEREDIVWNVMHLEGHVAAYQSKLDIMSEHRCLVVDGEIRAITLQDDKLTFATPGTKIGFHDELLPVAQDFVSGLLEDPSLGRSFTMDLARLTNGEVVIMELNPIGGAGFFDADTDLMVAAMASVALGTTIAPAGLSN